MELYSNTIRHIYNIHIASLQLPYGRRESHGTVYMEIKTFHITIFIFIILVLEGLWHLVLLAYNGLMFG